VGRACPIQPKHRRDRTFQATTAASAVPNPCAFELAPSCTLHGIRCVHVPSLVTSRGGAGVRVVARGGDGRAQGGREEPRGGHHPDERRVVT
jgi:hypothetical protein